MLVFCHCLNFNGPQFDCEINTLLRLAVGMGWVPFTPLRSYCLSGTQGTALACGPLPQAPLAPAPPQPHSNVPPPTGRHNPRCCPSPPSTLHRPPIHKAVRAGPSTLSRSLHLSALPFLPLWNAGLRDFPEGPMVRTCPSSAVGEGSVSGGRAKVPYASWPRSQNINKRSHIVNLIKTLKMIHIESHQLKNGLCSYHPGDLNSLGPFP